MIDLTWSRGRRLRGALLVVLGLAAPAQANEKSASANAAQLRVVAITEPEGQILSYRHLAGSTDVHMRGTALAREARVKLKIGSRPGFVELDINRGGISGLVPASRIGRDFLTYVLWAVSVDGKASNLGEITFDGDRAISVNLTTPYQTFWLMITAEPNYAVVDPSPFVVLYSVRQGASSENKALPIRGELFFFTHYSTYESAPGGTLANAPNQLLQARKAVELAAKSAVLPGGLGTGLKEEEYTREALTQATSFLTRAEDAYRKNPKDQEVVQFARTAAQSAENARALAMGAVGGLLIRQLETEVANLRKELARRQTSRAAEPGPLDTLTAPFESGARDRATPAIAAMPAIGTAQTAPAPPNAPPLVKQPALWFAIAGWALALVLLFRRRSI